MQIKDFLDYLNNIKELNYKIVILDFKSKKILDSKNKDYYNFLNQEILATNIMKCKTNINNEVVDLIYYVITPK